jgi:glycosyltransferase involved in cell wall biosynthesis
MDTLISLNNLNIPINSKIEYLIIDNGSIDDTGLIVQNYIEGKEKFKYIYEPKRGKGHALNTGILNSNGNIIAFTDDDAVVDEGWIENIIETFVIYKADCVGGKILPIWLGKRPAWLDNQLCNILAIQDLGPTTKEMFVKDEVMFFGVNVAIKRETFDRLGLYKTELDSRGGCGNEDQEIYTRILNNNGKAMYNPNVIVKHKVFKERLTKKYFRNWHYYYGKDIAKLDWPGRFVFVGIPTYMVIKFLKQCMNCAIALIMLDSKKFFYYELKSMIYLSFIIEKIKLSAVMAR